MNYEEQFELGFTELGLHIEPGLDTTAGTEYVAYGYGSEGTLYGDDAPCLDYRRWSVVYVAPVGYDRRDLRTKIREMIQRITGVWPSEEDITDAAGQRYIYDFETFGGIDNGTA